MAASGLVKNLKARAKPSVHKTRTLSRSKLIFHALDIISTGEINCNWTLKSHDLSYRTKKKTTKKEPVGKDRRILSGNSSSADSVVSGSSGNDSDLSNAHPNSISEVDDANSGKYSQR